MDNNEWISISDFMAGIVAIIMIMFVISTLSNRDLQLESKKRADRNKSIKAMLNWFEENTSKEEIKEYFIIDTLDFKITLKKGSFIIGSPCLQPTVRDILSKFSNHLKSGMSNREDIIILVAGHSDKRPISRKIEKLCDGRQYEFSDNVTLSNYRATEARQQLTLNWNEYELVERIGVLGYGSNRPIDKNDLNLNRRVEIMFEAID